MFPRQLPSRASSSWHVSQPTAKHPFTAALLFPHPHPNPKHAPPQEKVPGLIYVDLETDKGSNIRDSSLLSQSMQSMQSMDFEDGRGGGGGKEQGGQQPPPTPA